MHAQTHNEYTSFAVHVVEVEFSLDVFLVQSLLMLNSALTFNQITSHLVFTR